MAGGRQCAQGLSEIDRCRDFVLGESWYVCVSLATPDYSDVKHFPTAIDKSGL